MSTLNLVLRKPVALLALGLLTFSGSEARSALVIEVGDTTIASGGVGFADVWIRSTGTDLVHLANYKFQITQLSGTGELQFQASADSLDVPRQTASEQLDPDYVFFGDTNPVNFTAARQDPNRLQLVGGDFTASGNDVSVTSDRMLLARLELQHITPTPLASSGTYSLSLIEDPDNTIFTDENLDPPLPIDASSYTNSGLITVTAVPEPSSCAVAAALSVGLAVRRLRRKRSDSDA